MADVLPALLVDLYELTMADAYRRDGMADRPATFSLFVRSLPPGRGYLVAAGLDDCLAWLEGLSFGDEELAAVDRLGVFDAGFLDWLGGVRFTGSVRAVPEGTVVFPSEPVLEVDAPLAEGQLAETFLLNQVTLQTVIATKAARCRDAAGGRAVVDFSLRRTHGVDAGMKVAKVAGLVGLDGTSNVAGADRYGVPASGTMAHSFVQAWGDETEAFRAYARAFPDSAVLLVDTYDTARGVERAIEVALERRRDGGGIRGIRLDSGDLAALAADARQRLDAAGLEDVRIFASGGLDERSLARLVADGAPIDGFGVGSTLGVSADAPTVDTVYKLVAVDGRPVLKTSPGKASWPCPKQVWRAPGWTGDTVAGQDEPPPVDGAVPLLVDVMRDGARTAAGRVGLAEANAHFEDGFSQLPAGVRRLDGPEPYPVAISERLRAVAREITSREVG
ncbi:MAG TPA: nicotinate phosphoribosyltransferase [Acidimicrobiales bacterium]